MKIWKPIHGSLCDVERFEDGPIWIIFVIWRVATAATVVRIRRALLALRGTALPSIPTEARALTLYRGTDILDRPSPPGVPGLAFLEYVPLREFGLILISRE
jgi:hypothetical protein